MTRSTRTLVVASAALTVLLSFAATAVTSTLAAGEYEQRQARFHPEVARIITMPRLTSFDDGIAAPEMASVARVDTESTPAVEVVVPDGSSVGDRIDVWVDTHTGRIATRHGQLTTNPLGTGSAIGVAFGLSVALGGAVAIALAVMAGWYDSLAARLAARRPVHTYA